MMETLTDADREKLVEWLEAHELHAGVGTAEEHCSIAAINLALSGRLTDEIPPCMSEVIGRAIIVIQDGVPHKMRNSPRWKAMLVSAAGTGRKMERERLAVLLGWMWFTVLPRLQTMADSGGYGEEWRAMCEQKTAASAETAVRAAAVRAAAVRAAAVRAAADPAADAAAWAADAVHADAWAADAVHAAAEAACAAAAEFWSDVDPCGVLERMIDVTDQQKGRT
jgi:hypothetical protein